ncbi:hypothetical protein [Streptomyces sp. DSM 40750]|uniref:hypothetical protein n=1 Tax=Streptomyces sp. DSM 40750 TaxID=2801030 RepID=UPI00214BDA53|nr:hypothetical protein [Streptomyces sp. DSM 40750]UUU23848.1 hypothetical protein JIX55_28335 [Streptomyces sp. DSM 40750]
MELPAENKRTALLALAVLGALLAVALTVFIVFDGDDEDASGGNAASTATADGKAGSGGADADSGSNEPGDADATPIVALTEVAEAHEVMAKYMAGINTYDYKSSAVTWVPPLLELTTGDTRMKQTTVLPSGKTWATCEAEQCESKGTAVVVRDAVISDDLVRDSGRTISSLVKATSTVTAGGQSTTESNEWLVTVQEDGGKWVVSGFDIFGLGDVGSSDESGE